ncbi:hypothetical protein GCM10007916_34660 [Psychromonas marina]|uniref:YHS domain-containing protein n=1 Tax=Psychromonas marina TaxID=88364 RepID=A0ABQ6E502_9GAMM|nr:YHS domain-containing (seleno)protein [Psychromonas marina]GLS92395.1 hypothetical protein GCM10007916_34660 [Psychromonas marina]
MKKILMTLMLLISSVAFADEPVSKSYFGSVAISGVDTIAYHQLKGKKDNQAMMGNSRYSVEWKGANWYFVSQQSAEKFAADPARYQPNYNGFCANALSLGEGLIKTDGSVWAFFDDQLFLFYSEAGRQRWLKGDWKSYNRQAKKAWLQQLH